MSHVVTAMVLKWWSNSVRQWSSNQKCTWNEKTRQKGILDFKFAEKDFPPELSKMPLEKCQAKSRRIRLIQNLFSEPPPF